MSKKSISKEKELCMPRQDRNCPGTLGRNGRGMPSRNESGGETHNFMGLGKGGQGHCHRGRMRCRQGQAKAGQSFAPTDSAATDRAR